MFPGNTNFATYFHDETTGLNYGDQRFYNSQYGRFMNADPYRASAGPEDPGSWNRYTYTHGDPINRNDQSGLCDVIIAGIKMNPGASQVLSKDITDIVAYPFSDSTVITGPLEVVFGSLDTQVAKNAILAAAKDSDGPINITTISGGSASFAAALWSLPQDVRDRINNVTYLIPANANSLLPSGLGSTIAILGSGLDRLLPTGGIPGATIISSACGHDPDCVLREQAALLKSRAGQPCKSAQEFTREFLPGRGPFGNLLNFNYGPFGSFNVFSYGPSSYGLSPSVDVSISYILGN